MICEDCYKKLDGFHRFATMALRNQDKMTKFVCTTTNNVLEQKNIENKSLLHTYLTKVSLKSNTLYFFTKTCRESKKKILNKNQKSLKWKSELTQ